MYIVNPYQATTIFKEYFLPHLILALVELPECSEDVKPPSMQHKYSNWCDICQIASSTVIYL